MKLAPSDRGNVQHFRGATDADKEAVELVTACAHSFEQGIGQDFRELCNKRFQQYRGFNKWKHEWTKSGPNDKDGMLYDAKRSWGAHLHIPLSYLTIERQVPAAIEHRPRMLYFPRQERWQENVESVRLMIDAQQENIDIDLPFQTVMRAGRIYGLGVGKSYWLKEYASRRRMKARSLRSSKYVPGRLERECVFDDPMFEDVDPYDFMWDPFGSHLLRGSGRCRWVLQRVWMGLEGCLDRMRSGQWNTDSVKELLKRGREEEELRAMGSTSKYDEVWNERMVASGFSSYSSAPRGEHVHEVWEWHDGDRVITVLDRQLLVQDGENPCVGMIPFHVYRPTPLQRQMVGIGDLEPVEHLQRELDTHRSQMTDAITIALCAGFAYDSSAVDEEDIVFGPAAAIEVRNAGDVRNAIMPLPRPELPATAFEHERTIRADFDAVSGYTDALDPSQGSGVTTATQAQLVQAALSRRVALGSRRFEVEVVRQAARCFLRLDQRMITQDREAVRLPEDGLDPSQAMEEGRWRWVPQGPGFIQGEFEIVPDAGSMAARNIPQDRQDAQMFFQMAQQNPHIDPRWPILKGLELMGVRDPDGWLKKQDAPVPPQMLEVLAQMGVDKRLIQQAVMVSQRSDPQLNPEQQGPNVQQVDQMMGQPPEQVAA